VWVGWSKASVRRLVALLQFLSGGVGLCAVPTGGTEDPCSLATLGAVTCPITLPDFNPADWTSWFGCQIVTFIVTDLPQYASYVWSAIESYVVALLASAFSAIENALNNAIQLVIVDPITAVLNVLTDAVDYMVTEVSSLLIAFNLVLIHYFGPFAPVAAVTIFLLLLIALIVGVYYLSLIAWAVGKTLFNLL
jgi:hypothetical protein